MTLTLEITPETQRLLEVGANAAGRSVANYTAELLAQVAEEAAEDAIDVADAERIMANSDPANRRTLAELRTAIYGARAEKKAA